MTMTIKELLITKPHDLARKQHDALKEHTIAKIKGFLQMIQNEQYETAESELAHSPAGDGYGSDNDYLDFSETGMDDIGEVLATLKALKTTSKENK